MNVNQSFFFFQSTLEPEPWEDIQFDIETKIIPGSSL